ncbi:MAG: toll/interleukin-1 receptor domain-containing protein [Ginsengibacter sp.]
MKKNIIIDRAELLNLSVDLAKNKHNEPAGMLVKLAKKYPRIVYESVGMSAIEYSFAGIKDVADHLFAIRESMDFGINDKDSAMVESFLVTLQNNLEIAHAIQIMEKNSHSSPKPLLTHLGYITRLFLLANKYDADIFIWKYRVKLIETILTTAEIQYKTTGFGDNLVALEIIEFDNKIVPAVLLKSNLMFIYSDQKNEKDITIKAIYFSYAWDESNEPGKYEKYVDEIYDSLHANGYTLKRDKMDLNYQGLISDFIVNNIGRGNLIIVAISKKYLESPYCMFELYEIYRNSELSKISFVRKILPIRLEDINLNDPGTLKHYFAYWKAKEDSWNEFIKENIDNVGKEQFAEYDKIKQIRRSFGDLVSFIMDINALNKEILSASNYQDIVKAIELSLNKDFKEGA